MSFSLDEAPRWRKLRRPKANTKTQKTPKRKNKREMAKAKKEEKKTQEQYTILQEKEASQEPGMQWQSSKGLGAKILFDIKM